MFPMLKFTDVVRNVSFPAMLSLTLIVGGTGCKNGKEKDNRKETDGKVDSASIAIPNGLGSPIAYDSGKRYIFLAFDDGPQPPGTINCKKIFHEEGVKASFFLVAAHMFDPLRKRIVDSLNSSYPEFVTGNHSTTHGFHDHYASFYNHPDSAIGDMLKAEKDLNLKLKIARLPGMKTWASAGQVQGPKSSLKVSKALDSLGYTIIGWDIEWQFIKGSTPKQGAEQMAAEVNKMLDGNAMPLYQQNAIVLLAHDRMFAKPQYEDSLRKFITILKQDKRNVFETLDHYPTVQNRK